MTFADSEFTRLFLLLSCAQFSFCYWREKITGLDRWQIPSAVQRRITENCKERETAGTTPRVHPGAAHALRADELSCGRASPTLPFSESTSSLSFGFLSQMELLL